MQRDVAGQRREDFLNGCGLTAHRTGLKLDFFLKKVLECHHVVAIPLGLHHYLVPLSQSESPAV